MITYEEKGIGLHDAITAAGYGLWCIDGTWGSSNDAAVQAIIDGYSLDQAKAVKCAAVARRAAGMRDSLVANISPAEMASWFIKVSEAKAFGQNPVPESAPILSIEAQARGISLAEMVGKVDTNAGELAQLEALIAGADGAHRDAINAMTTFSEVEAYDFSGNWPEVQA